MNAKGILFSEMTPPPGREGEFNTWYDTEHIPIRMGAPGFVGAQRYQATDDPRNYLAVYDVESLAAFETDAYKKIKGEPSDLTRSMLGSVSGFSRYLAKEIGRHGQTGQDAPASPAGEAPVLYAVWFDVPPEKLGEFDDWYCQDHIPLLLECPEWSLVRRFEVVDAVPQKANRLALHYLKDLTALESPARAKARATPWRARLAEQDWFKGRYQTFNTLGTRFHADER